MAVGMYKIRFNLGRGEFFMKWKVTDPYGNHTFYDPEKVAIVMTGTTLINRKGTAQKIFEGANKSVCAWIECEDIMLSIPTFMKKPKKQLKYNPKINPFWTLEGEGVDGKSFSKLITHQSKVYLIEE